MDITTDQNYIVKECSRFTAEEWDNLLSSFVDYNLYQSYGWGEAKRLAGWNISRLACFYQGRCVGLLQTLYRRYKFLGTYIAWAPGGPVLDSGGGLHLEASNYLFRKLKERFSGSRYYLRIYPMQEYSSFSVLSLRSLGFSRPIQTMNQSLTYRIDTRKSDNELNSALTSNWRHNLNRSLKKGFNFDPREDAQGLPEFYCVYQEMAQRNKMRKHYSARMLEIIRDKLPTFGKLRLFLCSLDRRIVSGRIICVTAKKAYDLLAATSQEGRKGYAAYFLLWNIISWCRDNGIEYYDLSGVDPFAHKGIFDFKKGTGAELVEYVGEWEACNNSLIRTMANLYIGRSLKD